MYYFNWFLSSIEDHNIHFSIFQVCKFFLEAIEKNLYGWFWNCPNGEKCIYRHALPPGFVLKKDKKKMEDEEEKVSLEEHIENEVTYLLLFLFSP